MCLDAAVLIDKETVKRFLDNPLKPDLVMTLFGIPVIVSDHMPEGKVAFVSYKKPGPLSFMKEIEDIQVVELMPANVAVEVCNT